MGPIGLMQGQQNFKQEQAINSANQNRCGNLEHGLVENTFLQDSAT